MSIIYWNCGSMLNFGLLLKYLRNSSPRPCTHTMDIYYKAKIKFMIFFMILA